MRLLKRLCLGGAAVSVLLVGCGAKTGLLVPDVVVDRPDVVDVQRPPILCVDPTPDAGVVRVNLETRPQLTVADVFFLVDRTGSMDGEIDNIKANLQSVIVPQIAASINDVQFGLATYGDFPIAEYGERSDIPFTLVSPIERNVANVQGALDSVTASGGNDNPEAMVEALFQVATGEGYFPWIAARSPCPAPNRLGYGCFRRDALPIIILIADAPSHNGPETGGVSSNQYNPAAFTNPVGCGTPACRATRGPHTYLEAIAALRSLNVRVIGVNSSAQGPSGVGDLSRIATDTGTVTSRGEPLVISIRSDGADLDSRVVTAVQTFTRQVRFNASARITNLGAAARATDYVRAVRPVSATPSGDVQRTDGTTFYGVVPGTQLTFGLELVSPLPRMRTPLRVPARIQFLGDGRANLGTRDIEFVIPGEDGTCDGDSGTPADASSDL